MTLKESIKKFFNVPMSPLKAAIFVSILTIIVIGTFLLVIPLESDENVLVLNAENSINYKDGIPIDNLRVTDYGVIVINEDIYIRLNTEYSIFIIPDDEEPRYFLVVTTQKWCDDNTIIGEQHCIDVNKESYILFISEDIRREINMRR